jgi:S-DNA-T family DNA segregation ATPase FtsK/SpoIIIE
MKQRSKKNKRQKTTDTSSGKPLSFNPSLKNEIIGLILIAVGILLGLTIVSYHQGDPVGLLDESNIYQVKNWLGIFGSTIAAPLFQWTLGYAILILPLSFIFIGFYMMLRKPIKSLYRILLLTLLWGLFVSVILALPESIRNIGEFQAFYPSGFIGGLIAGFLMKLFGKFGSIFILIIIFLLLIIATFRIRLSTFLTKSFELLKLVGVSTHKIMNYIGQSASTIFKKAKTGFSNRKSTHFTGDDKPDLTVGRSKTKNDITPAEIKEKPEIPDQEEIEILHRSKYSDPAAANDIAEVVVESGTGEKESEIPSTGFEIQEAHQEKELDYDALIRDSLSKYQFPSSELLTEDDAPDIQLSEHELKQNARILEETLAQFGVRATVNRVVEGPVITLYEVKPAQGVKISQIVGLTDDLALAMRAKGIRMIAPIPGKAAIGIEIPNRKPSTVYFKSIIRSETFINFEAKLPLGIGKNISGEVYCADLTKMPHLLIAGATGAGKSVGINTMIASLLYRVPPSDLKFVLIDPKKLELSIYAKLKDHYLATCSELDEIVVTHPQNAILILRSVVNEMEKRYDKLAMMGVREISHYNQKIEEYQKNGETSEEFRKLPYLVVVIDELADLILSATREVEEPITRLAQMARAVGIHLIMATQRPSVDILTGLIKANFPARIAYQVATRPDSKVILDMYGAEKLIGSGDMLFMPPGKVKLLRLQNPLISTEEVERIIKHIRKQPKFPPYELKLMQVRDKGPGTSKIFERDELFEQAKQTVIRYQQGSVSLLQRKLKIGYARAARIIDELEEAGIVSAQLQEGKARDVLVSDYSPDTDN